MVLLDTNVLSELIRADSRSAVRSNVARYSPSEIFTAAICEAELRYGVAKLPPGRRQNDLSAAIDVLLDEGFEGQILVFDRECATEYGRIRAAREAQGGPISIGDAMIAATASVHGATLVTRNLRDFIDCGIELVNPWLTSP